MNRVVTVVFNGGTKEYCFLTNINNLKIGEPVVVDTSSGLAVAWIRGLNYEGNIKPSKWIVQKINLERYKKMRRNEMFLRYHPKPSEKQINCIQKMLLTCGFNHVPEKGWENNALICHKFISNYFGEAKELWEMERIYTNHEMDCQDALDMQECLDPSYFY